MYTQKMCKHCKNLQKRLKKLQKIWASEPLNVEYTGYPLSKEEIIDLTRAETFHFCASQIQDIVKNTE